MRFMTPILGFCAWGSGAGKTTLLTRLIPELMARGLRVSVIKHTHHSFDIDHPGKDSYRLREAGAVQTLLGSNRRWALMTELAETAEQSLEDLLPRLDASLADLIVVEGFRNARIPKIEVFRPVQDCPLLAATDADVIAVATDVRLEMTLPVLDLNDPAGVADFIVDWLAARPVTGNKNDTI